MGNEKTMEDYADAVMENAEKILAVPIIRKVELKLTFYNGKVQEISKDKEDCVK